MSGPPRAAPLPAPTAAAWRGAAHGRSLGWSWWCCTAGGACWSGAPRGRPFVLCRCLRPRAHLHLCMHEMQHGQGAASMGQAWVQWRLKPNEGLLCMRGTPCRGICKKCTTSSRHRLIGTCQQHEADHVPKLGLFRWFKRRPGALHNRYPPGLLLLPSLRLLKMLRLRLLLALLMLHVGHMLPLLRRMASGCAAWGRAGQGKVEPRQAQHGWSLEHISARPMRSSTCT